MADAFSEFLQEPTEATFLRLRAVVLADPGYDFYSTAVDTLADLVAAEDYAAVLAELPALMPSWLLSPRVHLLVNQAAEKAGDAETARREMYVARACLRGLLRSGDGTKKRPYLVTHVADEYDLLDQLDKEEAGQDRVSDGDGVFDKIACTDGTELWFDASPGLKSKL